MNLSAQKDSISLRKKDLQRKIFDSIKIGDRKVFELLQSQWVHRYGFESLPEEKQLESLFIEEKEFSKIISKENNKETLDQNLSNAKLNEAGLEDDLRTNNSIPNQYSESEFTNNINKNGFNDDKEYIPKLNEYKNSKEQINSSKYNSEVNQEEEITITEEYKILEKENTIDDINESKNMNEKTSSPNYSIKDSQKEGDRLDKEEASEEVSFPAPPPPTLNNLRRWISSE